MASPNAIILSALGLLVAFLVLSGIDKDVRGDIQLHYFAGIVFSLLALLGSLVGYLVGYRRDMHDMAVPTIFGALIGGVALPLVAIAVTALVMSLTR